MSGGRLRKNRPAWAQEADGIFRLGQYTVELHFVDTKHPWAVLHRGQLLQRSHGAYTGVQRFMTAGNAMRWVENLRRR
jgi:hypothetical protein